MGVVAQIGGATWAIDVAGTMAFMGQGPRLAAVDVSDPRRIRQVGQSDVLGATVQDVYVSGQIAYVACGRSRLLAAVSVAEPSSPVVLGKMPLVGEVRRVMVRDRTAIVADSGALRLVDVSEPSRMRIMGSLESNSEIYDIDSDGQYVFLARWDGLAVVDISSPSAPQLVSLSASIDRAEIISVRGSVVAVVDSTCNGSYCDRIHLLDASDPRQPREIGVVNSDDDVLDLQVSDSRLYIALDVGGGGNSRLDILDVSSPSTPRMIQSTRLGSKISKVRLNDRRLYFVTGSPRIEWAGNEQTGIGVVDPYGASGTIALGYLDTLGYVYSIAVDGANAFVPDDGGFALLDVTTPFSPRPLGRVPGLSSGQPLAIARDHAYVIMNRCVEVIEVSDKSSSHGIGTILPNHATGQCFDASVSSDGTTLYITTAAGLEVFDVSIPSNPQEVGWLLTNEGLDDVAVSDDALVVAGEDHVFVIDVRNRAAPAVMASIDVFAWAIDTSEQYAFLAGDGLTVVDIRQPSTPRVIGRGATPTTAMDVFYENGRAYVVDLNAGLVVFDVTIPSTPVALATFDPPSRVTSTVFVSNGLAFVGTGQDGLFIVGPLPALPPHPLYLPVLLRDDSCPPLNIFTDVALVIDASTSMLQPTSTGRTKLDAALAAARAFVGGGSDGTLRLQPGRDQVAVVMFNDGADLVQGLTSDRQKALAALASAEVRTYSRVELGISTASMELLGPRHLPEHTRAMVVLSDGLANPVPGEVAIKTSRQAREAGILVYVIGVGPTMNEDVLRAMASTPDRFWKAPDAEALEEIYRQLVIEVLCPKEIYWGRR